MKNFDKNEVTEVLSKIKKAIIDDSWSIETDDVIKKEPSFYTKYNINLEDIKEIIKKIEDKDFECKIEKDTNKKLQLIYLFKKDEVFADKKVSIYIRLCLIEEDKKVLASVSEVKFD